MDTTKENPQERQSPGGQQNRSAVHSADNFSHHDAKSNGTGYDTVAGIEATLALLCAPGQVVEARILHTHRKTVSGYYTSFGLLARDVAAWNGRAPGMYLVLNPVIPALLFRAVNRLIDFAQQTTTDTDIMTRRWLFLDFDPKRPAGISSSNEEHEAALDRARDCLTWLRALGFTAYILADSGNGAHILLRIDLPNDKASADLVKRCLEAVDLQFTDARILVDRSVYNAAQLGKLYGTLACKGDHTPERPHRLSQILEVSETLDPAPRALLESLAAFVPEDPRPTQAKNPSRGTFNLDEWIAHHALNVSGPDPWEKGRKWIFLVCPFNADHTNRAAVLLQFGSGAIAFRCLHNGCTGNDWHALRTLLDPGWQPKSSEREPDPDREDTGPAAPHATEAGTEEAGEFHLTDLGNGERFVAKHGTDFLYCPPWKKWLGWDGTRWLVDDTQTVRKRGRDTVRGIYLEAGDLVDRIAEARQDEKKQLLKQQHALLRHAIQSENAKRVGAMLDLAQMDLTILPKQFDIDLWALNVENGTIDLRSGALRPHARTDLLTKYVPLVYDPDATCPLWEQFLSEIMGGNDDLVDFLWKAMGYSLTGDVREDCLFLLYGLGRNGKTTFIETTNAVLGDYATTAAFSTFLHQERDSVRNDIADLQGARFVSATEADQGKRLSEALIKRLTGKDTMKARYLFQEYFQFKPQLKLWLATNYKPVIQGTDDGIWRRVRLIPFTQKFEGTTDDKHLGDKLKAELPGILAWIVRGCLAWQAEGLPLPDTIKNATGDYRKEMDVLGNFLEECCEQKPHLRVKAGDLYNAYVTWSGDKFINQTAFGRTLTERGIGREKKGPHVWRLGVALSEEASTRQ